MRRPGPRQPAGRPPGGDARPVGHAAPAGPAAGRPAARRRRPRPPDRVVVRHRPPGRRERRALGLRVRGLPGRARRVPRVLGLAPRAHRRDGRAVPLRPARGDRPAGGPQRRGRRGGRPAAPGFDLAIRGPRRLGPVHLHARPLDDGRRERHRRAGGDGAAGRGARRSLRRVRAGALARRLQAGRAPRRRRLRGLRAGRRLLLLLAHVDGGDAARSPWAAARCG